MHGIPTPPRWQAALSADERRELLELDPLRAILSFVTTWGLVFGAMAGVAWAPGVLSVTFALAVIGTRQLGLAVLMHDGAHRTLFRSRRWNDWAAGWLAGYPIWTDPLPYRVGHLLHHAHTGSADDPDLALVVPFPISRRSLWRKVWRDLSGQTGWKQLRATLRSERGRRLLPRTALANGVLLGVLALAGHPALYLLWVVAWLTTYRLVTRIRAIAEHAMAPDDHDALQNTRTTLISAWERLLVAPHRVNYHLEHHLLMTVPHYNLPRMHRLLRERGVLEGANVWKGYTSVLRHAASRTTAAPPTSADSRTRAGAPE